MNSSSNYRKSPLSRRILSFIMALALCLGLLPAVNLTALAADVTIDFRLIQDDAYVTVDQIEEWDVSYEMADALAKDVPLLISGLEASKTYTVEVTTGEGMKISGLAWRSDEENYVGSVGSLVAQDLGWLDMVSSAQYTAGPNYGCDTVTYTATGLTSLGMTGLRFKPARHVVYNKCHLNDAITVTVKEGDVTVASRSLKVIIKDKMTLKVNWVTYNHRISVDATSNHCALSLKRFVQDSGNSCSVPRGLHHYKWVLPKFVTAITSVTNGKNVTWNAETHTVEWDDSYTKTSTANRTYDVKFLMDASLVDNKTGAYYVDNLKVTITPEVGAYDGVDGASFTTSVGRAGRHGALTLVAPSETLSFSVENSSVEQNGHDHPDYVGGPRFTSTSALENVYVSYDFNDNLEVVGAFMPGAGEISDLTVWFSDGTEYSVDAWTGSHYLSQQTLGVADDVYIMGIEGTVGGIPALYDSGQEPKVFGYINPASIAGQSTASFSSSITVGEVTKSWTTSWKSVSSPPAYIKTNDLSTILQGGRIDNFAVWLSHYWTNTETIHEPVWYFKNQEGFQYDFTHVTMKNTGGASTDYTSSVVVEDYTFDDGSTGYRIYAPDSWCGTWNGQMYGHVHLVLGGIGLSCLDTTDPGDYTFDKFVGVGWDKSDDVVWVQRSLTVLADSGVVIDGYLTVQGGIRQEGRYDPGFDGITAVNSVPFKPETGAEYHIEIDNKSLLESDGVVYAYVPIPKGKIEDGTVVSHNTAGLTPSRETPFQFNDYTWEMRLSGQAADEGSDADVEYRIKYYVGDTSTYDEENARELLGADAVESTTDWASVTVVKIECDALPQGGKIRVKIPFDIVPTVRDVETYDLNGKLNIFRVRYYREIEGGTTGFSSSGWIAARLENAAIKGFVFVDKNGNGIFDSEDVPVRGVAVKLYTEGGEEAAEPTTTDDDGNYLFGGLDNGTYKVTFENADTSIYHFTKVVAESTRNYRVNSDAVADDDTHATGSATVTLPYNGNFQNGQSFINAGFAGPITVNVENAAPSRGTLTGAEMSKDLWPGEKWTDHPEAEPQTETAYNTTYSFWKWTSGAAAPAGTDFDWDDDFETDTTVYANWKYHMIYAYGLDGQTTAVDDVIPTVGRTSVPDGLTHPEGYELTGWKYTADNRIYSELQIARATIAEDRTYVAQYEPTEYTITYDLDGGSLASGRTNPTSYTIETDDITLNNPTKAGYTFAGWTGTDLTDATESVTIAKGSTGDRTYTATWTAENYTISYNLEGGELASDTTNPETYTIDTDDITLSNPTKTGYVFAGWTGTDLSAATTNVTIAKGSTGNRTYTATWTAGDYTITYDLDGGSLASGRTNPTSYTIETDDITLNNPTKAGYTFAGWTGTDLTDATESVTIAKGSTGDRAYTATWTAENYTITYNLDGGSLASGTTNPTSYTVETNNITLNNPTKTGYVFAGWTGTDLSAATTNVTIAKGSTGNRTYTATWTAGGYTITYDLAGGSLASGRTNPTSYTIETDDITLNNPTKAGYTFAGWTGTDLTDVTESVTIAKGSTGDRTYTATWTAENYTITYDLAGGSLASGRTNPTSYTVETNNITLNNPTKTGYVFAGWTGTDLSAATTNVTIAKGSTGNRTYTATWVDGEYTITYNLDGGTNAAGNPNRYTVDSEDITLSDPTKNGYTFDGWYTDSAKTAKVEGVAIAKGSTGDKTFYAKWKSMVTVTFLVDGSEYAKKTGEPGADITGVAAPRKTGYTFNGWKSSSTQMPLEQMKFPNEDTVYVASWEGNALTVTAENAVYDGTPKTPELVVKVQDGTTTKTLLKGQYVAQYSNNTNATHSAKVEVYGVGDYAGLESETTFTIEKAPQIVTFSIPYPSDMTYADGATFTDVATAKLDAENATISYTTTDAATATVDAQGKLTIKRAGIVTVIASAAATDNVSAGSASYTLTINKADPELQFANSTVTAKMTDTVQNPLTKDPASLAPVTYASSDTGVAAVDSGTGAITLKNREGTTTITATFPGDDKYNAATASYTLNVENSAIQFTASDYNGVYDAQAHGVTVNVTEPVSGATVTYADSASGAFNSTPITLTNVGTKTVYFKITAPGYADATGSATVSITPAPLDHLTNVEAGKYTGNAVEQPDMKVVAENSALRPEKNTDYTVAYVNNVNASAPEGEKTAVVIVTGQGNYTGTLVEKYTIAPKKLTIDNVTVENAVYDGTPKTPKVTVMDGDKLLTEGMDYTLEWADNVQPSDNAKVTVKGKGNYNDTINKTFSIIKEGQLTLEVMVDNTRMVYDGTEWKPAVLVTAGTTALKEGADYTVRYTNNVNAGTGYVFVDVRNGDYAGYENPEKVPFTIEKADQTVAANDKTAVYGDAPITVDVPTVTREAVKHGETAKTSIDDSSAKTVTYISGNPDVVVWSNDQNGFEIKKAGTAIVTASVAEGANFNEASTTFTITVNPRDISRNEITVADIAPQTYTRSEINPKMTVEDAGEYVNPKTLAESTDYTLSYTGDHTNIGIAKVTIIGVGNYTGSREVEFAIVAPAVALEIAEIEDQTYTGSEITPPVSVTFVGSTADGNIVDPENYDVTYEENLNVGTATVTVRGKDGTLYAGAVATTTFEIVPKSIANFTASTTFKKTYDGSPIVPSDLTASTVEVKSGNKVLTLGKDYVVETIVDAQKDVGKYAVKITGQGNYTDSVTIAKNKGVEITPDTGALSASLSPKVAIYDGTEQSTTVAVMLKADGTALTVGKDYELSLPAGQDGTLDGNVFKATEIGTYKILAKGINNYSGELNEELTFTIEGAHNLIATIEPSRVTYNGAKQNATVTVVAGGDKTGETVTLVYGTDYTLELARTRAGTEGVNADGTVFATNVGTYNVTVNGKGNYADRNTPVLTFVVDPKVITFNVTLTQPEYTYDHSEKKPDITVEDGTTTLRLGTDYVIDDQSTTKATEAGTYTVLVKGIGNYAGSTGTAEWVIHPMPVSAPFVVEPAYTEADYDGQDHAPAEITVKSGEGNDATTLDPSDYALTYTFSNNEGETEEAPFIPGETKFTEAGVYTIYARTSDNITENGNVTPYGTAVVFIKPTNVSTPESGEPNFTVTLAEGPYYYNNGEPVLPTDVKVLDQDGNELTEREDYYLTYDNNIDAGTATVTAVGTRNFSGAVSNNYEILPMPVIVVPVDVSKVFTQVDSQSAPVFGTFKASNKNTEQEVELKDATLSNLSRAAGEDVGKYAYVLDGIAITGEKAGNYALDVEGSKQAYEQNQTWFSITPKAIDDAEVTFAPATLERLTYNGKEQAPAFTLTDKYSKPEAAAAERNETAYALVKDTDFKVSYKDSQGNALESVPIKAGTYKLVITAVNDGTETATGNYSGAIEKEFTIDKATLTELKVTVKPASETYDGKVKNPTVTVEGKDADGNTIPVDADNYDLVWKDSKGNEIDLATALKDVGKYTVTATAKDNAPDVNATHQVTVTNDDGTETTKTEPLSGTADYQIKKKSSGGGGGGGSSSSRSYTVNVASTKGGSVTSSKDRAVAGVTVTVTVKPDEGNTLSNLAVTDENGKSVAIKKNAGDGTYTFTMPASDVTITSSFLKAQASADDTGVSRYLDTKNHVVYLLGRPDGTMRPADNITRAETAMIFYRLLLNKNVTLTASFEDVPNDAWYATAVRTLASMGVLKGVGDGKFAPERTISRAEFAAVATRFAKAATSGLSFNDVPDGYWAKDSIITAATYGWINGDGNGNFRPEATLSRAEAATIVNHMLNRAADKEYVSAHTSELAQFTDLQDPTKWYYLDLVEAANAHDYTNVNGEESWSKINK